VGCTVFVPDLIGAIKLDTGEAARGSINPPEPGADPRVPPQAMEDYRDYVNFRERHAV
jgi:hypothetical protein